MATVQSELNRADLNDLAQAIAKVKLGDVLARLSGDAAVEETVTVTSNVGVLAKRALSILAVAATAGTHTTTGSILCPPSQTPATLQAAVGLDRKTITFAAGDGITAAHVLYIPAPDSLETNLAATLT